MLTVLTHGLFACTSRNGTFWLKNRVRDELADLARSRSMTWSLLSATLATPMVKQPHPG
jgi:hypothetical protein